MLRVTLSILILLSLVDNTAWSARKKNTGNCKEALVASRAELITKSVGKEKKLKVKLGGKKVSLTYHTQYELEQRIHVPEPFKKKYIKHVIHKLVSHPVGSMSRRDIGPAALSDNQVSAHESEDEFQKIVERVQQQIDASPEELFTKSFIVTKSDYNDRRAYSYKVGYSHEYSTYFDTPEHFLKKKSVAVRIKSWVPDGAGKDYRPIKAIFIKTDSGHVGEFKAREEIQLNLEDDWSEDKVRSVVSALLEKETGVSIAPEEIVEVVEIENRRYNVDLLTFDGSRIVIKKNAKFNVDADTKKIGFVTIDTFRARAPGNNKWKAWRSQFELEILPDERSRNAFVARMDEVDSVTNQIISTFSGELTEEPKYITGLRAIQKK